MPIENYSIEYEINQNLLEGWKKETELLIIQNKIRQLEHETKNPDKCHICNKSIPLGHEYCKEHRKIAFKRNNKDG